MNGGIAYEFFTSARDVFSFKVKLLRHGVRSPIVPIG
jgi:hypothetical protein